MTKFGVTPGGGVIAPINAIMDRFAPKRPKNNKCQVVNQILAKKKSSQTKFQKTIDGIVVNIVELNNHGSIFKACGPPGHEYHHPSHVFEG